MSGALAVHVYKILPRSAWITAQDQGRLEGSELDLHDGYIHLSTAAQARETARLHFAGQAELVILQIEAAPLGDTLKWEPSRGGQLFPHLYGPLDPELVMRAHPLDLNAQGWPDPGELAP